MVFDLTIRQNIFYGDILHKLDLNKTLFAICIDLLKSFDTIDRGMLMTS